MKNVIAGIAALVIAGVMYFAFSGETYAPLPGEAAKERAEEVGRIEAHDVTESSGIVASRQHAGVFWTHNDKGNSAAIFAISREGRLLAQYRVDVKNDDWEDIAIDDHGRLYIGRIGNNEAKKDEVAVYRIEEPDPEADDGKSKERLEVEQTWRLKYPAEPFDAEALCVHGGYGYVIAKTFTGGPAGIYRFPLDEGEGTQILEHVTDIPVTSPVTAADISPDGRRLAILCFQGLVIFDIGGGNVARAGSVESAREAVHYDLPALKFEACCFTPTGILLTAESREIYFCPTSGD